MKFLAVFGIVAVLAPFSAQAVCAIEPLEPDLRAASVVYVGTVIRSELARDLPTAAAAEKPTQRRIRLRHTLKPEITLKGDPSFAAEVISSWQYNPPTSKSVVEFAELSRVMPGDTLLVVARAGEPTFLSLCTPTREWNRETAKVVRAVFPPAP